MVSGSGGSVSRQSNTNTERRLGSTGSAMPASAATSPDHGPAAITMVRAERVAPERSITLCGASPTTSSWMYSTPCSRALRRNACISAGPSNQPSLAVPCEASATPSLEIAGNRCWSACGSSSSTAQPSPFWIAWLARSTASPAGLARKR